MATTVTRWLSKLRELYGVKKATMSLICSGYSDIRTLDTSKTNRELDDRSKTDEREGSF